ncbi:hypothetical protein FHS16_006428 [Paenibacillus endophyticus]|uniref:Uncharacterized protein n=1 Tax=Paenibacillus endophyticus TaxID=1294268 RepID=A0A7W5CG86_9BACL|nr:hypothetical protein [Paenibacillus endophyticus]MBB3156304.1 hypothetical protein [Paenibacillus endophyticus]
MSYNEGNIAIGLARAKFSVAESKNIHTGRERATLSSVKKVRIMANRPAWDNASDITDSIGIEFDVV